MNITVNPVTAPELEWVIEADRDFPHPWEEAAWRNLSANQYCFVAKNEQGPAGFTLFQYLKGDEQAHLLKIYVPKHLRSQGIAEHLLLDSIRFIEAREVFLEVAESNVVAQRFYEKMGFAKIHLAKRFYSDGENAWFMTMTTRVIRV